MPDYNLHQHTLFSDGNSEPAAYAAKAVELGFSAIGFTEHSPLPFPTPFSLKMENINEYIRVTGELKEKYSGRLEIYRGLEMDFVPEMSEDFSFWRKITQVDYLIGSVHLVKPENTDKLWFTDGPDRNVYDKGIEELFGGDVKKAVTRFFTQTIEMIETQDFEVIGHFDKVKMHNQNRFFREDEKWYQDLIDKVTGLIKQKGIIAEINTRGLYKKRSDSLFPDGITLKKVKENNIPVMISSDAHQPDELNAMFDVAEQKLKEYGFKTVMKLKNGEWIEEKM